MSHYKDLREVYAKEMEFHGFGYGLFQPIAGGDMTPPCFGFFDRNGDWNLLAKLATKDSPDYAKDYTPLKWKPKRVSDIGINWQPKTSLGVQAVSTTTSLDTPDQLPAGANAQVKYESRNKFGAVLMTQKLVTLKAYNEERLFKQWLEANRGRLYELHGSQLKKYGMWLVTRTYTCEGCSINAWLSAKASTTVNLKAKASMLGEIGQGIDWKDNLNDRDWSHYMARDDNGLVVFLDGIHVKPIEWRFEGFKQNLPGSSVRRSRSARRTSAAEQIPEHFVPEVHQHRLSVHYPSPPLQNKVRRNGTLKDRPVSWATNDIWTDGDVLKDVGVNSALARSRSPSSRTAASMLKDGNSRTPSLRRESRSISQTKEAG